MRKLRDQFCTLEWSQCLYNGMYFSPEREWIEKAIVNSQDNVTGKVRLMVYKGNAYVLGRSSSASNLYSEQDASMDSLEGFSPMGHDRVYCHPVYPPREVRASEDQRWPASEQALMQSNQPP